LILNLKERFQGKKYPVCKPYPHQPDIKVGCYKHIDQYRLYCKNCDTPAENAIPKNALSKEERDNAGELVAKKK